MGNESYFVFYEGILREFKSLNSATKFINDKDAVGAKVIAGFELKVNFN